MGRAAGCLLGKPVEWGDHWTPAHLRSYLELADAWPLTDYFPVLDPMPDGYERPAPDADPATFAAVLRETHRVSFALEKMRQKLPHSEFVVNNQKIGHN